jgi:chromate reductase
VPQIKILAFCGSLKKDSFNRKLLLHTCDALKEQQCEVTFLDLKSLSLPIYDGDFEDVSGLPEGAKRFVDAISDSQALLIASPEYNGSVSGALKNAIDWATRAPKSPFAGKVTMIIGTSPGHWGATKSLLHLRQILTHIQAIVIPTQLALPYAEKSIDSSGALTDPTQQKILNTACSELLHFAKAFAN